MRHLIRTVANLGGLLIALAVGLAVLPGRAEAKSLLDTMEGVLKPITKVDGFQMVRFSVAHPVEAGEIFSHAVAQDYPYFGIIGGIEIARKNGMTEAECLTPVTMIKKAFGYAQSTISNGAGKSKLGDLVEFANTTLSSAADMGATSVQDALYDNIPYLNDLPTMCSFAYGTNLQSFNDIYTLAGSVVSGVVTAYKDFKNGEIIDGIGDLMAVNISSDAYCHLIDDMVSGGLITSVPILGDVVAGACSGFVGAVIDGVHYIVKGVKVFANAVYDELQSIACSLPGVDCGSPPSLMTQTKAIADGVCAKHNGLAIFSNANSEADMASSMWSKAGMGWGGLGGTSWAAQQKQSGKPLSAILFVCKDETACRMMFTTDPICITKEMKAARREWQEKQLAVGVGKSISEFQASMESEIVPRCPDDPCKFGVRLIKTNAVLKIQQELDQNPGVPPLSLMMLPGARKDANALIEDYKFRKLPPKWQEYFIAKWSPMCSGDEKCVAGVKLVALGGTLRVQQAHEANTSRPYSAVAFTIYADADKEVQKIVAGHASPVKPGSAIPLPSGQPPLARPPLLRR